MKFRFASLGLLGALLWFGGCATPARRHAPASSAPGAAEPGGVPSAGKAVPAAPSAPAPRVEAVDAKKNQRKPGEPNPPTASPTLHEGEFALLVESEPSGALLVVNGRPSGKTPGRVVLGGNPRGFLRETVSIKVRFIAPDQTQDSRTIEEVLTPLDKVPAALRFTPDGAQRMMR
jgi:hypothetical protein